MNIEIQKYYVENKKRIVEITEELKIMSEDNIYKDILNFSAMYEKDLSRIIINTLELVFCEPSFNYRTIYDIGKEIISRELQNDSEYYIWEKKIENSYFKDIGILNPIPWLNTYYQIEEFLREFNDSDLRLLMKNTKNIVEIIQKERVKLIDVTKKKKALDKYASLTSEKGMLEKINKQLEKEYDGEIIKV